MPNLQPNRYTLQSSDGTTKVDYETTSIIGQAILNLTQGSNAIRHFAGAQIRSVSTEIGTLVSITTRMTVDTGSASFSVLIPSITLTSIGDHRTFHTEAIVTSHTGPNSVPNTGVQETYQFIPMKGQANFVLSLAAPGLEEGSKAAHT